MPQGGIRGSGLEVASAVRWRHTGKRGRRDMASLRSTVFAGQGSTGDRVRSARLQEYGAGALADGRKNGNSFCVRGLELSGSRGACRNEIYRLSGVATLAVPQAEIEGALSRMLGAFWVAQVVS